MDNPFSAHEVIPPGPPRRAVNVNPSNDELPFVPRYIWVGTSGDLVVLTENGDQVTYAAHPVGRHELAVKKILPATTAGALVIEV